MKRCTRRHATGCCPKSPASVRQCWLRCCRMTGGSCGIERQGRAGADRSDVAVIPGASTLAVVVGARHGLNGYGVCSEANRMLVRSALLAWFEDDWEWSVCWLGLFLSPQL